MGKYSLERVEREIIALIDLILVKNTLISLYSHWRKCGELAVQFHFRASLLPYCHLPDGAATQQTQCCYGE